MNAPDNSCPAVVTRREACHLFDIKLRTWNEWERTGRVPRGRSAPVPGKPGRRHVYPLDQLLQLRDELAHRYDPYPDPDRPGCYRLPLVSDKYPGEAIFDAESLPLIQGRRWYWAPGHRPGQGSVMPSARNGPKTPLRQVIMGVSGREHPVSHLNGDPRDLRRENLVVRTVAQVAAARRKTVVRAGRPCSSRYKGVSWSTDNQRWCASIKTGGTFRSLGQFKTELAAAVAYDTAARELVGPHAALNFLDGPDADAFSQAMATENYEPPFPPPGSLTRRDACRMFEVSLTTWTAWEQAGRIGCGYYVPNPRNKPGRAKVYPLDELHRLLELYHRIGKPYPDSSLAGVWRVPIRSWIHSMEALIDADDLPLVEGRHWNWSPRGRNGDGEILLATVSGPQTPLARLITDARGRDERVMHANHNPLDCRRRNLVVRTPSEQLFATRKMGSVNGRQYTSRYKGVSFDSDRGKWKAQIRKGDYHRMIGRFDTEQDAAEAYDNAARALFGEHAHLNFPDSPQVMPARAAA